MDPSQQLVGIWPGKGKFANITWQVSDVCNFRCSYCNPGNYGAESKNQLTDRYIQVLDTILDDFIRRGYTAFKVFFSGGEPSIWPPLVDICKFLQAKVKSPLLAINTNLSRPLRWWKENVHLFDDVVASYHVEFTDPERYLENVKFLQDKVWYLACRMLMHDERFSEVVEMSERLKRELSNYIIEYAPLFEMLSPHGGMHHYQEEWKRDFLTTHTYEKKETLPIQRANKPNPAYCMEVYGDGQVKSLNSNRVVAEGKNNFEGWMCWISDSIFINPRGDIKLASCNVGSVIGNINEGRVNMSGEPAQCFEKRCNCGTDINIPKVAPGKLPLVERAFGKPEQFPDVQGAFKEPTP